MSDEIEVHGKPKFELWVLIAACAFPVVASWLFYINPDLLPKQQGNHGDLIHPPRDISSVSLYTMNGQEFSLSSLHGSWTLVTLSGNSCNKICQQHIHDFRQIRLAVGENMYHIQRLLILSQPDQSDEFDTFITNYSGTHVVTDGSAASDSFLSTLNSFQGVDKDLIYLIDPMGKLMMRYPSETSAKDILKDLERLLKATKHWLGREEPGQSQPGQNQN